MPKKLTKKRTIKKKITKKGSKKKRLSPKDVKIDQILLKTRCIFISGVIDEKLSASVTKEIIALSLVSSAPIIIRINSCGGSCMDGMAIIDTMTSVACPIITIICGKAFSMGGIISIAGDIRFMTKNSIWLGHPISAGGGHDYLPYKRDRTSFWNMLDEQANELFRKYTKLTPSDLAKIKNGELWLNAEDCVKKGIADKIM